MDLMDIELVNLCKNCWLEGAIFKCNFLEKNKNQIQSEINLNKRKEGDLRIMSPLAWMRKELIENYIFSASC